MENRWSVKGVHYECCRTEGHCPLWFGRDLWKDPCVNLRTFHIRKGHIKNGVLEKRGYIKKGEGLNNKEPFKTPPFSNTQ